MKKRVLSLFMVLALCLSMTPTVSFAEETGAVTEQEAQSGESIIDDTTDVYTTGNDVSGGDVSGGDADAQDAEKDAAVQAAQALIDALPDEVTAENADELQAQLIAIDEALAALDEAQTAKLDMTRYEAICAALTTFVAAQDGGHSHTICGATTCNGHEAGSSHDVVEEWIPLSYDASTGKLYKGGDVWEMDTQPSYKLEGGYYYLETDIEIPSYTPPEDNRNLPSIRISGNVSLCLNGHSITQDNGVCAISIPNGSTNILSLCDCANDERSYITAGASNGVFFGNSSFNMYGGIIKDFSGAGVNGYGTFNMYGGTITGNATGVVVGGNGFGGTFNMYGGEIIDNKGNLGGGVYVLKGTFTMSGGKINGNNASTGGGVYVANGTFTMSGGEITGNNADRGGGVYVANGTFTMSGGKITGNNTANPTIKNGNVYVDAGATFKVSGMAKIYENWINSDTKTETGVYEAGSAGFVCNVYLPSGKTITIGDSGLEDGASIGVTYGGTINADTDATIATGADNGYSTGSITSDNTSYHVWRVGDEVKLTAASLQEHPICGGTCTDGKHSNEVWKGISDLSQITSDGNYYLTDNVQLTDKWYFPSVTACPDVSNVKLCLNGKTITGASGSATIMVKDGSSLDITDCADSQESIGKITHASGDGCGIDVGGTLTLWNGAITGNSTTSGGGVKLSSTGNFTMYGGTITGNKASTSGGGVYVDSNSSFTMNGGVITGNNAGNNGGGVCVASSGTFTMNGGTITGNNAGNNGGGVYVASSGTFTMNGGTITGNNSTNGAENIYSGGVYVASSGIFTVSGEVNITNNWKNGKQNDEGIYVNDPDNTDSKAGNVYLAGVDATVATITIGAAGLTEKAKIGVSKAISNLDAGNVYIIATNATDEDMKYFTPDVPDKYFITSDGEGNLKLGMHQHSWTYTLSDDATITATCSNADTCPDTEGGSVTIEAPVDLIYDSGTKDARVIPHGWLGKAVADIEISYKDANGDLLNGEPINVGTYIASITLTNEDNTSVTAEVEFTIEAVELTNLTVTAGAGGNYDGSEKRPTVTVKNGDVLISPDEYEVTYSDNINAGIAKVTVKSTEGSNYKISGSTTFTIDKATITVIPDAGQSKIYGNDDPELTYDFSGAVNNETPAFTGVLSRTVGEDTGDYAINIGDLKLADNGNFKVSNYELKLSSTEVNFTINRRPVTITGITANNKTYDGTTDATFDWSQVKFEGLLDKDSLLINEIQGSFGDARIRPSRSTA